MALLKFSSFPRALVTGALLTALLPAAQAKFIYALTSANQLIGFDSTAPGVTVFSAVPTGLQPMENLTGIDFRPATGELMGLGTSNRLYRIFLDHAAVPQTATAVAVGDPFEPGLSGEKVGVDFNPAVDRLRVITNAGSNVRLNPTNGSVSGIDTAINPPTPIGEIAYNRNYPGTPQTTLFGLDFDNNSLVRIGGVNGTPSPNGGAVTQIGPLGLDFTGNCALDFGGSDLLAILRIGEDSILVQLNPQTGSLSANYGLIAGNAAVSGMAVAPNALHSPKLSIKRLFSRPAKDSIKFSTLIDVPAGFQVEGAEIHLNIGGMLRAYTLEANGKDSLGSDKVSLKVKLKNGEVPAQRAKFTARLGGGTFTELDDDGLFNTTVKNAPVQLFVSLAYGSEIAQGTQFLTYTAKQGRSGKAKN